MHNNVVHILSTALLPDDLLRDLDDDKKTVVDSFSFIETHTSVKDKEQIITLAAQQIIVVVTSKNAVEAILPLLAGTKPDWKFYCLEGSTNRSVAAYFGSAAILATAADSKALAAKIMADHITSIVFFCGQLRLDVLPEMLLQHGVQLKEVVVYKTIMTPREIEKNYDAILFFSPSGVQSFFSLNSTNDHTVLFAIGNTTASAIRELSKNEIIVSPQPDKKIILQHAIAYTKNKH